MQVLLGVCAHVDIIVDFVPKQFTCAAEKTWLNKQVTAKIQCMANTINPLTAILTLQVSVNLPKSLENVHIQLSLLKR